MAPKQRMRIANEKASKYVTMRGNVPKSSVSVFLFCFNISAFLLHLVKRFFRRRIHMPWLTHRIEIYIPLINITNIGP